MFAVVRHFPHILEAVHICYGEVELRWAINVQLPPQARNVVEFQVAVLTCRCRRF